MKNIVNSGKDSGKKSGDGHEEKFAVPRVPRPASPTPPPPPPPPTPAPKDGDKK